MLNNQETFCFAPFGETLPIHFLYKHTYEDFLKWDKITFFEASRNSWVEKANPAMSKG